MGVVKFLIRRVLDNLPTRRARRKRRIVMSLRFGVIRLNGRNILIADVKKAGDIKKTTLPPHKPLLHTQMYLQKCKSVQIILRSEEVELGGNVIRNCGGVEIRSLDGKSVRNKLITWSIPDTDCRGEVFV